MRAVFPESFDPATSGHLAVARRAAELFDELVICVLTNPAKSGRHPLSERLLRLAELTQDLANVTVDSCIERLLVDYCRSERIDVIVRGLRSPSELGVESAAAQLNRKLIGIETLFIPAEAEQAHVSSKVMAAVAHPL